jgi:hypothetical protein
MDLKALLDKKKKAAETNKPFPKSNQVKANNNNKTMPMRKSGRGK